MNPTLVLEDHNRVAVLKREFRELDGRHEELKSSRVGRFDGVECAELQLIRQRKSEIARQIFNSAK